MVKAAFLYSTPEGFCLVHIYLYTSCLSFSIRLSALKNMYSERPQEVGQETI